MNQELIDLAVERGRLIERISQQRQLLDQQLRPLSETLDTADRLVLTARRCGTYLKQHPEVVGRGLQLKKVGNEILRLLGGREVHPVNVRVGGFYKLPDKSTLQTLAERLRWAREALLRRKPSLARSTGNPRALR